MTHNFASFYDAFMEDIDYDFFVDYVKKYWNKAGIYLDAGCGSGTLLSMLFDLGFHMEGIDIDEAMLTLASRKTDAHLFIHDLHEPMAHHYYDGIMMFFDVLNYSNTPEVILKHCFDALKPGGILLFDVHAEAYLNALNGHVEEGSIDELDYTWKVHVKNETLVHHITLKENHEHIEEQHTQYFHSIQGLNQTIKTIGF